MIEDLYKIRQDVHMQLRDKLVAYLPKIYETYNIITKDELQMQRFNFPMKINHSTTKVYGVVETFNEGFSIENDYYWFDIIIETKDGEPYIKKIICDNEELLVGDNNGYFSNLDTHHLQPLRHLYYTNEAFLKNEVSTCI